MGRLHTLSSPAGVSTRGPRLALRVLDCAVATVALVLALPLMAIVAIAVRASSHGPVLRREPVRRPGRATVNLLSFRTLVDGGETVAHAHFRAAIGAAGEVPLTKVGRVLRRTRLDRLPRLVNVLAGHVSLFG